MAIAFRAASGTNSATTTSITINKPTGTVDGDFMLAIINANTNITITPPAGWTSTGRELNPATGASIETFYKKASSEGASWAWTISSNVRTAGAVASFSGTFDSNAIHLETGAATSSGTGADRAYAPALSPTVAPTMSVYLSGIDDSATTLSFTQDGTYTQAVQTTGAAAVTIAYKALSATGDTGQIQATTATQTSIFSGNHHIIIKETDPAFSHYLGSTKATFSHMNGTALTSISKIIGTTK